MILFVLRLQNCTAIKQLIDCDWSTDWDLNPGKRICNPRHGQALLSVRYTRRKTNHISTRSLSNVTIWT